MTSFSEICQRIRDGISASSDYWHSYIDRGHDLEKMRDYIIMLRDHTLVDIRFAAYPDNKDIVTMVEDALKQLEDM